MKKVRLSRSNKSALIRKYIQGYRRKPESPRIAVAYMAAIAEVLQPEDWTTPASKRSRGRCGPTAHGSGC